MVWSRLSCTDVFPFTVEMFKKLSTVCLIIKNSTDFKSASIKSFYEINLFCPKKNNFSFGYGYVNNWWKLSRFEADTTIIVFITTFVHSYVVGFFFYIFTECPLIRYFQVFIECIINFIRKKIYVKVINRTLFVQCKHSNGIRLIEIIQNKSYWLCLSYFQGHLKMFYRECWMHQAGKYRDQYRQR